MMWSKDLDSDLVCLPLSTRFVALMSSWRGLWVSAWVVMQKQSPNSRLSAIANLNISRGWNTEAIKRAFKDGSLRDHLAPLQLARKFARCACRRHAPFGVQSKHNSDFFREDTAFLTSSGRQRPREM